MRHAHNKKLFYRNNNAIIHYKQKYKESIKSIKQPNNSIKPISIVVAKSAAEQLDGGKELTESTLLAHELLRPAIATVNKAVNITKHHKQDSINKARSTSAKSHHQKKHISNQTSTKQYPPSSSYKQMQSSPQKKDSKKKPKKDNSTSTKTKMLAVLISKLSSSSSQNQNPDQQGNNIIKSAISNLMALATPLIAKALLMLVALVIVIVIPLILVIAAIYNSPFAIFFPPLKDGDTVMSVTSAYEADFIREANDLAAKHKDSDRGQIVYKDFEGDVTAPDNYFDIMAVYMVKNGIGDTATDINEKSKENLKKVYDDMNSYDISYLNQTVLNPDGTSAGRSEKVLCVNIKRKTYQDMIDEYDFSDDEISILEEMMNSDEMASLGSSNVAVNSDKGTTVLSTSQKKELDKCLKANDKGCKAVRYALSRLGAPYSSKYRTSGSYYDSSSLIFYAWKAQGVDMKYQGSNSVAQIGKWCNDKDNKVELSEIKPGDLIFYKFFCSGGYKDICHVAMYCGNDMVVEASYNEKKVIYRKIYNKDDIVMVGRPK